MLSSLKKVINGNIFLDIALDEVRWREILLVCGFGYYFSLSTCKYSYSHLFYTNVSVLIISRTFLPAISETDVDTLGVDEINSVVNVTSEPINIPSNEKMSSVDKLEPSIDIKIDNVNEFNSNTEKNPPETLKMNLESLNRWVNL